MNESRFITIENPIFNNGTYVTKCMFFSEKKIGSILCVGHSILKLDPCEFHVHSEKEDKYYLELLKEHASIVTKVFCERPGVQQTLF